MREENRFVIASGAGISIRSGAAVSDAIGACLGTRGLVLTEHDLGAEFFNLHTGLAGELFQKFVNYRVRLAIVLPNPDNYGERFAELVREHSTHHIIRFFGSMDRATAWLLG